MLSSLQEDDGEGHAFRVGEGEVEVAGAEAGGELGGDAVEVKNGLAAGLVDDLEILPTDAVTPAGANGLHAGFLGGEAGGVAFGLIGLALDVGDLSGGVDAVDEAGTETVEGVLDAVDFAQVRAEADDASGGLHLQSRV